MQQCHSHIPLLIFSVHLLRYWTYISYYTWFTDTCTKFRFSVNIKYVISNCIVVHLAVIYATDYFNMCELLTFNYPGSKSWISLYIPTCTYLYVCLCVYECVCKSLQELPMQIYNSKVDGRTETVLVCTFELSIFCQQMELPRWSRASLR